MFLEKGRGRIEDAFGEELQGMRNDFREELCWIEDVFKEELRGDKECF